MFPETPAMKAGLEPGMEIIKIENITITTPKECIKQINKYPVGTTISIQLIKGNNVINKQLNLAVKPELVNFLKKFP